MNVLIAGGTGFIGTALTEKLVGQGTKVFILTRQPQHYEKNKFVTYLDYDTDVNKLPKLTAVINLAGESLFGRWTQRKKERILSSRIDITEQVIRLIDELNEKPDVFINASAIGFYGMNRNTIFTEKTTKPANDFLANVTYNWEQTAMQAEKLNVRTVLARFGIVLDKHDGALSLMNLPFKQFVGGKIGSGEQWMSWIHLEDCVNMLFFAIQKKNITGPLNITAPYPQRNRRFTKTLGRVMKRPTMITVPKRVIQLTLGEMGSLITEGQFVYPKKALQHHFSFTFPHLKEALKNILRND